MTIRLPDQLYEHYRREAYEQRTKMSSLILAALQNDYEDHQ